MIGVAWSSLVIVLLIVGLLTGGGGSTKHGGQRDERSTRVTRGASAHAGARPRLRRASALGAASRCR